MRDAKAMVAMALLVVAGAFAASAVDCITDVMVVGGSASSVTNSYAAQGWTVVNQDLNAGAGGDYIYLLYKEADSASVSNGFITDFYIKTGDTDVTQTHNGRTYRLVPYDGGSHFRDSQGDLNSNAGGKTIHLYYTRSAFPDNRAVAGVTFNDTKGGAVGADGGSTGYDLNKGCGELSDFIYMHVSTVSGLFEVTDVAARQRWPWNGLVDITCKVSGIEDPAGGSDFAVAAVMADSSVHSATHFWVVRDGKKSTNRNAGTNGNYRLLWDAGADLGTGEIHSNVVVRVTAKGKGSAKVQLWKGGPYWATTNIGAERPEDYGYYFWWGDTVGYKWENEKWVASNGSSSNFSFEERNAPTCGKDLATLQREGWITAEGVLSPDHDAAHVHWGGAWRMPTRQELDDLVNKCNWNETTLNGVNGWTVTGRDAYESASIFLPCAGGGYGASLYTAGSYGYYWSSVPTSDDYNAWYLGFTSGYHGTSTYGRSGGQSVRPVQGFTE